MNMNVMSKRILTWRYLIPLALMLTPLLAQIPVPALANPGLSVSQAAILASVEPGQTLTHTMTVAIDSADAATEVSIDVAAIQQLPNGSYELLDASHDMSQYSARQFVTVDKAAFHLEPGSSENITATVTVPHDVGDGGRYAMIHIAAKPADIGGVVTTTAVDVPVYLTVSNSQLTHTGEISGVSTGEIATGRPISVFTDFQSTGNHHFKVKGEVAVTNDRGQNLDAISIPLTPSSILPGMVRRLEVSFVPGVVLEAGKYTVESKVMLEDGTLLDQSSTTFEVNDPYTAPPGTLVISAVSASGITATSATITWTTSEAATSEVEYGPTEEYGSSTTLAALVTGHSVDLAGLKADTTYHYRAMSKDASNNDAVSLEQTFTTAGGSTGKSPGGVPSWAWVVMAVAGVGVAGGAAYFIGTKTAKK